MRYDHEFLFYCYYATTTIAHGNEFSRNVCVCTCTNGVPNARPACRHSRGALYAVDGNRKRPQHRLACACTRNAAVQRVAITSGLPAGLKMDLPHTPFHNYHSCVQCHHRPLHLAPATEEQVA
eukprot:scaffold111477_cov32-Tisochrysis_lutea.AAC.1